MSYIFKLQVFGGNHQKLTTLYSGSPIGCPRNENFAIFLASSQLHGWYFWSSFIWSLLTIYPKISFQRAPRVEKNLHCRVL